MDKHPGSWNIQGDIVNMNVVMATTTSQEDGGERYLYKHEKEDDLGLLPGWDSEYEIGVGRVHAKLQLGLDALFLSGNRCHIRVHLHCTV